MMVSLIVWLFSWLSGFHSKPFCCLSCYMSKIFYCIPVDLKDFSGLNFWASGIYSLIGWWIKLNAWILYFGAFCVWQPVFFLLTSSFLVPEFSQKLLKLINWTLNKFLFGVISWLMFINCNSAIVSWNHLNLVFPLRSNVSDFLVIPLFRCL